MTAPHESTFASWLARRSAGEQVEFEALLREHPDQEAELRELHAQWLRLEALQQEFGLSGSLAERLKAVHGSSINPEVDLPDQTEGDFTAELVGRLSDRTPSSTRYRHEGELARGGMGAVLSVWDEDLRRRLAMKVLLEQPGASSDEEDTRRRLARLLEEAQVTAQLDHPGIVPVHELGLGAEGEVYFTMKLVRGRTLATVFNELAAGAGGWTQPRVLGLLIKVCEAMSYAHAKGVMHRDLKPANVMVGKFGEVYVMDWGLAKVLGREDDRDLRVRKEPALTTNEVRSDRKDRAGVTPDSPLYTMDGDVVGTPAYMSPEQASGRVSEMGPPSDVYALGAMLYQLLAGHMPYVPQGARLNNYAVWQRVQEDPPRPLNEVAPEAPAELVAICERAMAREAGRRYADTGALAEDLSAYVEGRVVSAYETGAWAEARKWVQRNRPLAASLAAAVLLLMTGLLVAVYLRQEAQDSFELAEERREQAEESQRVAEEEQLKTVRRERELLIRGLIQELEQFHALENDRAFARSLGEPTGEWWLREARRIINGQEEDPARGLLWRPGLADAESRLTQLREEALDRTEAEIEADRHAFAGRGDLNRARQELRWVRRMLGEEAWPAEAEIRALLGDQLTEIFPPNLNQLARAEVGPESTRFGEEIRARIWADEAVERANEQQRTDYLETLAWARLRTGDSQGARDAMQRAIESAPEERKEEVESWASGLEREIESLAKEPLERRARVLSVRVQELELGSEERRTWTFPLNDQQWWHDQMTALVEDLRLLRERLRLAVDSIETDEARALWSQAQHAIQDSERYGGLRLSPQVGLLPIGEDPDSGLWEFAHLQSGERAVRGEDGRVTMTPKMGLVFVLIPGGTFVMGAQAADPSASNHDPSAVKHEGPPRDVTLSPYFISKYEMTNAQREQLEGRAPLWGSVPDDAVTEISWVQSSAVLQEGGMWLHLPTEAQWEMACRGGTSTPWWTGEDEESLRALERFVGGEGTVSAWTPGTGGANPFGLYDMHGNVHEWCMDFYVVSYHSLSSPVNPVCLTEFGKHRTARGGSFGVSPYIGRSASRWAFMPTNVNLTVGLRPARAVLD